MQFCPKRQILKGLITFFVQWSAVQIHLKLSRIPGGLSSQRDCSPPGVCPQSRVALGLFVLVLVVVVAEVVVVEAVDIA